MFHEADLLEVDPEDILYQTDHYYVVIITKRDPDFPDGEVFHTVYGVVNKLTGVQEAHVRSYPGAVNWIAGLQEALEAVEGEEQEQQEFEWDSDTTEPTVN